MRPDLTMTRPLAPNFSLIDHEGRSVTQASYPGQLLLIFFGFTNCRAICPRTLAKISQALDLLGRDAEIFTPLYVTVDPERDTPSALQNFLIGFPRFKGLTGSVEQIRDARQNFRVFANRINRPEGGYDMPHTAFTYALATDGTLLEHWPEILTVDEIATRLRSLIQHSEKEFPNG